MAVLFVDMGTRWEKTGCCVLLCGVAKGRKNPILAMKRPQMDR